MGVFLLTMKNTFITGVVYYSDKDFWINDLRLKRTGNSDYEDKLLNRLIGYEIEAYGLIYKNVFFMRSYILKGKQ